MGNFSEVAFSEVKEVKTNVSALVIYWFQNTYFFKSAFIGALGELRALGGSNF